MNSDVAAEYAKSLGQLLANFQALEYLLRAYLYEHESEDFAELPADTDWYGLSPGDVLPLNALTSFESLRELIIRYNGLVKSHAPDSQVDESLVAIRDALAHGRVPVPQSQKFPVLLKFDRPKDGHVRVTDAFTLSLEWLAEQGHRVWTQLSVVHAQWQRDSQ